MMSLFNVCFMSNADRENAELDELCAGTHVHDLRNGNYLTDDKCLLPINRVDMQNNYGNIYLMMTIANNTHGKSHDVITTGDICLFRRFEYIKSDKYPSSDIILYRTTGNHVYILPSQLLY